VIFRSNEKYPQIKQITQILFGPDSNVLFWNLCNLRNLWMNHRAINLLISDLNEHKAVTIIVKIVTAFFNKSLCYCDTVVIR
jgi:hypothetical protein